ncbi:carboxylesterase family protein [Streptomyces sp. TRM68367]|uniref:carboxylesterase family protein n=1 Tax=Streptomyces sp. TRM68367 TaxID=2758415 RepID=UPI00293448D5|nr:carboxylesterase family protein [Streptomyces sp. TRM68367]
MIRTTAGPVRGQTTGESSGGRAVCTQLASPPARGLFRAAISQSASYRDCAAIPVKDAETTGRSFAEALGCTDSDSGAVLDCLRTWSSFVAHGVPRAPGLPDMADQRVRPGEVTVLQAASAGGPRPGGDFTTAHHCALWDAVAATG